MKKILWFLVVVISFIPALLISLICECCKDCSSDKFLTKFYDMFKWLNR